MSSKFSLAIVGAVVALTSVGCAGRYVTREDYDRDLGQLKEYKDALEKENAELRLKGDAYDRLKTENDLNGDSAKFYAELADSLKKALSGMGIEDKGEIFVNEKKGSVEFASTLLFDLGSWTISTRGKQALKAFAEANRGNVVKIVGHADKKPIVRPATQKALETGTNMELSARRAIAVMGELLHDGLREVQIGSVEGHGTEATERNGIARCVEIFVVKGASVAPTSAVKPAKTTKK
ncbi:MAG TPA: OmpA family protein [Planctomycetota bacterium]|jgi:flagellar motor protein MotB|nr:OmpA family protein [Planctomycetota bacterium]